jgi:hypothetical protein
MGPEDIIFLPPSLYFLLRILQRQEPMSIQTFIPVAAVEGFNKGIIGRFSRSGEVQRHLVVIGSSVECLGDDFTAVVYFDTLRNSSHSPLNGL